MSSLLIKPIVQHHRSRVSPIQLRDFPLHQWGNLTVKAPTQHLLPRCDINNQLVHVRFAVLRSFRKLPHLFVVSGLTRRTCFPSILLPVFPCIGASGDMNTGFTLLFLHLPRVPPKCQIRYASSQIVRAVGVRQHLPFSMESGHLGNWQHPNVFHRWKPGPSLVCNV